MGSCLIAYSGGVDSSFLLKVALDTIPGKILALTFDSGLQTKKEINEAALLAVSLGVPHRIIKADFLKDKKIKANSLKRCYFCKHKLLNGLKCLARKEDFKFIAEASTVSDEKDFRPGARAVKELGISSPLKEVGFTKKEIRVLSKKMGLKNWNKPSEPCLATRVAYDRPLEKSILKRVELAEEIIKKMGFNELRVRDYDDFCRIEVVKKDIPKLILNSKQIVDRFKKIGYNYITIDLEGYRSKI